MGYIFLLIGIMIVMDSFLSNKKMFFLQSTSEEIRYILVITFFCMDS